jgi:hypothetical protein
MLRSSMLRSASLAASLGRRPCAALQSLAPPPRHVVLRAAGPSTGMWHDCALGSMPDESSRAENSLFEQPMHACMQPCMYLLDMPLPGSSASLLPLYLIHAGNEPGLSKSASLPSDVPSCSSGPQATASSWVAAQHAQFMARNLPRALAWLDSGLFPPMSGYCAPSYSTTTSHSHSNSGMVLRAVACLAAHGSSMCHAYA